MLHRATVSEVKSGKISKADGFLVVTMRMYPRFLTRQRVHEFRSALAPEKSLFDRYREFKKQTGNQDDAFERARYQQEFELNAEGMQELKAIVEQSSTNEIYLICQCDRHERCHVDLMLLIAEKKLHAKIESPLQDYPLFRQRLK